MASLGVVIYTLGKTDLLDETLKQVRFADAVQVIPLDKADPTALEPPAASLQTGWVLVLWNGEKVTEELKSELEDLRKTDLPSLQESYLIPVRSLILGRFVKGSLWGPNPSLRLTRNTEKQVPAWWNSRTGSAKQFKGFIEDHALAELKVGIDRMNAFSSYWAKYLESVGYRFKTWQAVRKTLKIGTDSLVSNGFLFAGLSGWAVALLSAYTYLLTTAKIWEARETSSS